MYLLSVHTVHTCIFAYTHLTLFVPQHFFEPFTTSKIWFLAWVWSPYYYMAPLIFLHITLLFRFIHFSISFPCLLFSLPLLLHLAHDEMSPLSLSRRKSPLTKSVCLCEWKAGMCGMRLPLYVYCSARARVCKRVQHVCGLCWPAGVTDFTIVLSQQVRRWFTCQGAEGQEADTAKR